MIPRTPLHAWIAQLVGVAPEALCLEHVRAWQLEALRRTLDHAVANSPFYGERLRVRGHDLRSLEDLTQLPFTTSEDLRRDPLRLLCVSQSEIERVVSMETSGTTGRPKRLFFTREDLEHTTDFFAHGITTMVGSGGRVLLFMPGQRPGSVGDLLARGLRRIGATCRCHGFAHDLDEAVRDIAIHGSDCLVGIPSQILAVARHGRGKGMLQPGDVGSVLLSGDPVTPALREAIAQVLECKVFAHYGLTETGLGGGVECRAQAGVHLREADLYMEIVDPLSGQPVPAGQEGEVVLTTLRRRGMPLLRYRTGDLGRLLSEVCPCGTSLPRLLVRGRATARVRLAHGSLESAALDDALWPLEGLSFHEAQLTERDGTDILRVALWSPIQPAHYQVLLDEVRARISETPGLRDALEDGSLRLELIMADDPSRLPPPCKRRIHDLRGREKASHSSVSAPGMRNTRQPEELLCLVERLGSRDTAVRYSAASALVRHGNACVPLLHELLDQEIWDMRQIAAIDVLNRLGDLRSVPILRRALSRAEDHARLAAIRGLRRLCCEPGCFLDALEDPCWEVRREAIFALCDLHQPRLLSLVANMARDQHPLVRGAAINVLAILGDRGDADVSSAIETALEDRSEWVRSMAVWSVGHLGLRRHAVTMARTLMRGGDMVRDRAACALSRMDSRDVLDELMRSLPKASHQTQIEIVRALGCLDGSNAVPALARVAASAHPDLADLAVETLLQFGEACLPSALELLCNEDALVRARGVSLLGALKLDRTADLAGIADIMAELLDNPDVHIRHKARIALERLREA